MQVSILDHRTTAWRPTDCNTCHGTGAIHDFECRDCDGTGAQMVGVGGDEDAMRLSPSEFRVSLAYVAERARSARLPF